MLLRSALLLLCCSLAAARRVLCVFPVPSRSHHALGRGVVTALLGAGHEITWVTPFPEKDSKNLKFIDVSPILLTVKDINMMDPSRRSGGVSVVREMAANVTAILMSTPAVEHTLTHDKYDAVVTEWFFNEELAGIAAVLQVPWLLLNGMVYHPTMEYLMDSVSSPAVVPMMMNDFDMPMSFLERVKNTFIVTAMIVANHLLYVPESAAKYEKLFSPLAAARGVTLPPFERAMHDVSAVFVNSHPSVAHAVSLPPNVIDVGGYHIDEVTPPLPEDLKKILDESPQGVIYFSMGSVLKSANLPPTARAALLRVFASLPHTVLWKFEEELQGLPPNVHTRQWMPQQSILNHKNVRLFITHGGMLSSLEAARAGVPLLAVPMFGDQHANAARAQRLGYALTVNFGDKMAAEVGAAVKKMMADDRYYKKAKSISKIFRNRPTTPTQLIVHYTELAIETGGSHHLRSKAQLYTWYQRLLLDQLVVLLLLVFALKFTLKKIVRRCCTEKKVAEKKIKHN